MGPGVQRGQRAERGQGAGTDVVHRHRLDHRGVRSSLRDHEPTPRLEQRIEAGSVLERPGAPPVDVAVHETRVAGTERTDVEPQFVDDLAAHVLHQRVGPMDEGDERARGRPGP